ncbi:MAG: prepilin-type N-terminal cleavage/methylation domain-containing protein [Byssovorax sp.]
MITPKTIRRGAERGFTLIELVVALSAGLMVSMAALLLSRNATKFFQNEARISATQLAATLGMNRLTQDIQRASFLSSRNNITDKTLCTNGALPANLAGLSGIRFRTGGSVAFHPADLAQAVDPQNGLNPDNMIVSGSMNTSERFAISWTFDAGGQRTVDLQLDGAIARLRQTATQNGQTLSQILTPIFTVGRFLRFADDGRGQGTAWGIISGFSASGAVGAETIRITLNNNPAIPLKTQNTTCGLSAGSNRGIFVTVVSRILYDLRSLKTDAAYGTIVAADPTTKALTGEDLRTELVRVELAPDGSDVPGSLELVAELAADLKFGVTKAPAAGSANVFNPQLTTYGFGDPLVMTTPELVHAVQVRLSTRARIPDRENAMGASGRNYRFAVLQPPIRERFVRLRTLHATVALPNQADFTP